MILLAGFDCSLIHVIVRGLSPRKPVGKMLLIHLPTFLECWFAVSVLKNTRELCKINNSLCKYHISGNASMKIAKYAFNLSLIRQRILF